MAPSVACLRYNSRATLISISVSLPFSTAAAISFAAACAHSTIIVFKGRDSEGFDSHLLVPGSVENVIVKLVTVTQS